MDKQQAAEAKYPIPENLSVPPLEVKLLRAGYKAGLEDGDAKSPLHAIAFAEWCAKEGLACISGTWKHLDLSNEETYSTVQLYQLFNPSGAVQQDEDPFIEKHLGKIKELQAHYAAIKALEDIAKGPNNNEIAFRWMLRAKQLAKEALKHESAGQQVFTREQVIKIAKEAMCNVKNGDWDSFSAFTEYMNTNYPIQ